VAPPPRFSAPAPHVAPAPRFAAPRGAPPRISAPHVATPRVATPRHAAPDIARHQRGPGGPVLATPDRGSRKGNAVTATPGNLPRNAPGAIPGTTGPSTVGQGPAARGRDVGTVGQGPAARGRDVGTVGQGPAAPGRNAAAASQALVQAPNGRLGIRNPTLANMSTRDPASRALARSTFGGRFAQSRAAGDHDWRWRHHRHFPFVLGFAGPVFWPYAYDDFVDYTYAGYGYDTFWPYAFDDFYTGIYGGYAPEFYADTSGDYRVAQGSSRRARARLAAAPPSGGTAGAAQICTAETQGLTDFPIQRIAQQVQPDQTQQALLDELKAATAQAVEMLRSACPSDLPSTPTARIAAVRQRVEAMLQALRLVRPAVEKFYASLSDEQKQRFNALDAGTVGTVAAEGQPAPVAQACGQSASRALELPIGRVQSSLHLSAAQEAALKELKDASAKAADILAQSCPADQALTPPGRLAAMEQRLAAMLQGLDIVQPALANFYNSLSDEQKAQINRIGPRAA
jgi:LTXXQ motif family protein